MSNNIIFLPYVTEDLSVSTDTPPFDFCPIVDLATYHGDIGLKEKTQFAHSLPYDRHMIRVSVYNTDYAAALASAGYSGSLQFNFVSAWIVESSGIPSGLPLGIQQYLTPVWDGSDLELYYFFRPKPNWSVKWFNVVLLFNHDGQDDYVMVPVSVSMAPYNKLSDNSSIVYFPDDIKVYQNGVAVSEICQGDDVYIEFETATNATMYKPTVILERDGEFAGEFNTYPATRPEFPALTDGPMEALTETVGLVKNTYRLDLDDSIQSGDCFYFLFKFEEEAPPACEDAFCIDLLVKIIGGTNKFLYFEWTSDLGPGAANITFQYSYTDEAFTAQTIEYMTTDSNGDFTEAISISLPQVVNITVSVNLGICTYTFTWVLLQQFQTDHEYQFCEV